VKDITTLCIVKGLQRPAKSLSLIDLEPVLSRQDLKPSVMEIAANFGASKKSSGKADCAAAVPHPINTTLWGRNRCPPTLPRHAP